MTYRVCWSRDVQTPSDCETFLAQVLQTNPKKTVRSIVASILPTSLAAFLCDAAHIDQHTNISSLKKGDRAALVRLMTAYELDIGKNEGFAKAEVSAGGVPLHALDLATMELRGAFLIQTNTIYTHSPPHAHKLTRGPPPSLL